MQKDFFRIIPFNVFKASIPIKSCLSSKSFGPKRDGLVFFGSQLQIGFPNRKCIKTGVWEKLPKMYSRQVVGSWEKSLVVFEAADAEEKNMVLKSVEKPF